MAFERPAPDLTKLLAAWEEFERGEQPPGKTAGLAEVLNQLVASGWSAASDEPAANG